MKVYTKFLTLTFFNSLVFVTIITLSLIFILNLLSELDFFKDIDVDTYFLIFLSILNGFRVLIPIFL